MTHTPSHNDIVNEYLGALDPAMAPLFHAVRAVVLAAGPSFNESIKWKNCLVYATTRNHICARCRRTRHLAARIHSKRGAVRR